jgi:hypothetical protein
MSDQFQGAVRSTAPEASKVLTLRVTDDLKAQLDLIAQLNNRSITEESRLALEAWVTTSKSDPKVLQRADTVRREIEREAETKRNAIAAIFGDKSSNPSSPQKPARSTIKQAPASAEA